MAPPHSVIDCRLLIRNHMAFIVENLQYYLQVCFCAATHLYWVSNAKFDSTHSPNTLTARIRRSDFLDKFELRFDCSSFLAVQLRMA